MKLPVKSKFFVRANQALKRFRGWKWFVPALAGGAFAVLLPAYFAAAHFGHVPPALKPANILKNPIAAVTQTITHQSPSPSASPNGSTSPSPSGKPGATTPSSSAGGSAPAASNEHKLILENSSLTMRGGSIDTPEYVVNTHITAPNGTEVSQPMVTVQSPDISILVLPNMDSGYVKTDFNSKWNLSAHRLHPEGSGTTTVTLTAHDRAGNTYSGQITIKWLPIPYYKLSNARAELVQGYDTIWGGPYTGVVLRASISTYNNFGTQKLNLGGFTYPFNCSALDNTTPSFPSTITYTGQSEVAVVCWLSSVQEQQVRTSSHVLAFTVQANSLWTDFSNQSINVTVPAW